MSILAFIPARGGSKGIPRKNLALLNGKALLQYTIEVACRSRYVDETFLSSDDPEISAFAESVGLCGEYRRPPELAADSTPMIDAVLHGINWLEQEQKKFFDAVLLLQPTSPLRQVEDVDHAIEQFVREDAESLIGVHEMREHPYECIQRENAGWSFLQKPSVPTCGRQEYGQKYYFINGAIYLAKIDYLRRQRVFFEEGRSSLYVMPAWRGTDVDDPCDLRLCEFYLNTP